MRGTIPQAGPLQDIVDDRAVRTDAPDEFLIAGAVATYAAALGQRVTIGFAGRRLNTMSVDGERRSVIKPA